MSYNVFSLFYDELMREVDYPGLAEYLIEVFKVHSGEIPDNILDVACGTGSLAVELCKRNVSVIGCDASDDMLSVAHMKTASHPEYDAFFLRQSMQNIDMLHLVEGAVSTFDSLNHITDIDELNKVFQRVHLFLKPGGLFVFDVNTVHKHKDILADNSFVYETDNVFCVWQNRYIEERLTTEITLDMFYPKNGLYERSSESFYERAYTPHEIEKIISDNKFELLAVYKEREFVLPDESDQRVFYVVKKGN